jgi:rod shape-determining protein MreC
MMFRRTQYIALVAVLMLVVVVLNLPPQTSARLKLAIGSLFLPLFGLATSSQQLAERGGDTIVSRKVLVQQLNLLREENQRLKLLQSENDTLRQENERLRLGLNFQRQTPLKVRLARVISRDPANWWRNLQIDLGTRDHLRVDLPVVTAEGLVGKIANVGPANSHVVLLGDPNCRVAALVNETRDNGIIGPSPSTAFDPQIVDLTYLAKTSQLKPGQHVVTSGIGGVFPKGLTVGEIVDTRLVGHGLYTEARVKLAVNLNKLEEVWVIVQ